MTTVVAQNKPARAADAGSYMIGAPVVALIAIRMLTSWSWINGAFFGHDKKISATFLSGQFLMDRINGAHGFAASSLYPWIGHFLSTGVANAPGFWAWMIFLGEAVAGLSFLLGVFTRVGGLAAVLSALANLMVAGSNGADTIGQNYMLLVLGAVFLVVGAGRWFGLDGWLQTRYPDAQWLRIVG